MEIQRTTEADRPHIIPDDPRFKREGERLRRLGGMLRVAINRCADGEAARIRKLLGMKPVLTTRQRMALEGLQKYGPAEDCRQSIETVFAYKDLDQLGLVKRKADETYITDAGREALKLK